jgi:hypothetical protein
MVLWFITTIPYYQCLAKICTFILNPIECNTCSFLAGVTCENDFDKVSFLAGVTCENAFDKLSFLAGVAC